MARRRKYWTIEQAAMYLETRVDPGPWSDEPDPVTGFEQVCSADTNAAVTKLSAAGVLPEPGGGYWREAVRRAFPPRRGRPPISGPRYRADLGGDGQPFGRVATLAGLMIELKPRSVQALAKAYAQRYSPRRGAMIVDKSKSAGFAEMFELALLYLENEMLHEQLKPHELRAIASAWRAYRES